MLINAWNRMCALDDGFFARFISLFNIGISFLTQFSLWMLGAFYGDNFAAWKGSYLNTLNYSSSRLFWPFFVGFICSILLILGIILVYQKIKNNNIVNPIIGNINNNVHNKPLVTTFQAAVLLFIVLCFLITVLVSKLKLYRDTPLVGMTAQFFCFILFPILLVPNKNKCIKFLLSELKQYWGQ